jgi:hypothetical protein
MVTRNRMMADCCIAYVGFWHTDIAAVLIHVRYWG